jgi:phosphoheptose isomerase
MYTEPRQIIDISKDYIKEINGLIQCLDIQKIIDIAYLIKESSLTIFCGNGGSYTNASHMAGDILINSPVEGNMFAIGDNLVSFSAYSNDISYERAMAEEIIKRTKLIKDCTIILLSTSGTSKNILQTAIESKKLGFKVVSLVGAYKDILEPYSDIIVTTKSLDAGFVEVVHDFVGHCLVRILNNLK